LVALACSVGLCPVVTMLGVVLGLFALHDVRVKNRRGRRLAIVAIVLGLTVTPLTTFGLLWWNSAVREPMLHGPMNAILAGQNGDAAALAAAFESRGADAANAAVFLAALSHRYGTLVSIEQDPARAARWDAAGWAISVPYVLRFIRESVPGRARYVIASKEANGLVLRFSGLRVGEAPSLNYPPGASCGLEDATPEDRAPAEDDDAA
jgi:hypothetical protein